VRIYHSDRFVVPLPADHRFPIRKYALLRERLERANDDRFRFEEAPRASYAALTAAHDARYVDRVFSGSLSSTEIRKLGFAWSQALVERSRRSVGATIAALDAAIQEGVAVSLAGGTHHAHRNFGGGFCVFNDVACAALVASGAGAAARVLIVDCDVHQGDGTARILAAHDHLYTFSIHSARNYPHHKAASDCDFAVPDGTGDAAYLGYLEVALDHVFHRCEPDAVIYLAGADPYIGDRLGRLDLSKLGLARRDELVFEFAARFGAPIAVVMGGGYAHEIEDAVDIHCATVQAAADSWSRGRG
jgi:acetoin utilization deacetylase AcuC-like enzyme